MRTSFSTLFGAVIALAALFDTVCAATTSDNVFDPSSASVKIDYQPALLSPPAGTVWYKGLTYSASWNQTLPEGITTEDVSATADLKLGYTVEGESSLHLEWTLAEDISLYAPAQGSVEFTFPLDLEDRDAYFLVLLGSTHNRSPEFTITTAPFSVPSQDKLAARTISAEASPALQSVNVNPSSAEVVPTAFKRVVKRN
ncbi:hypothetical protein JCM8547_009333 [Rhodosporidiobolus lusitaniae]